MSTQLAAVKSDTALATFVDTWRGQRVNLIDPDPATIRLDDIAWSLAAQARFNGHTLGELPYSVAQHSIWVALYMEIEHGCFPEQVLQGLLHDAHEAYIGDITTPLKLCEGVAAVITPIADGLQAAIHQALDVYMPPPHTRAIIRRADRMALAVEAARLMASAGEGWNLPSLTKTAEELWLSPLPAEQAFEKFWVCHELLKGGHSIAEVFGK